jgi:hypothetical protein
MLLLALFAIVVGHGITGRMSGILISSRRAYSLSQLQIVLWTIVIISAFLAVALANLALRDTQPLAIGLPQTMWAVLGISTTSLVGTPLLRSTRASAKADPKVLDANMSLAQTRDDSAAKITPVQTDSAVVANTDLADASVIDIFRGEEAGNFPFVDVSKVQLFFFTLVLVVVYAVAVGYLLATASGVVHQLPGLDTSFVALLGISHGGYLTSKAVPHTPPPPAG